MSNNTHKFSPLASKMLCIPQINALDSATEKAQVKQLNKSIEKALLLEAGYKWLQDTEGKQYLIDCKLTQEIAVQEAYGLGKSTYSCYIRIAKAITRIPKLVESFLTKCDAKQGAASYAITALDKYIKALDNAVANPLPSTEGSEEGEGEDTTEGRMDKVDVTTKPIITLAFNGEAIGKTNVSLRITDKGEMKTTSSAEDIQSVIAYLQKAVKQMKADKPKAAAPKVDKPKAAEKPKDEKANEVKRATLPKPKAEDKPKAASKFKVKPTVDAKTQALADFEASLEPTELVEEDSFFLSLSI
jgi:hypothetical protein